MSRYRGPDGRILPNLPFGGDHIEYLLKSGLDSLTCGCRWDIDLLTDYRAAKPQFEFRRITLCGQHETNTKLVFREIDARKTQLINSMFLANRLEHLGRLGELGRHLFCEWRRESVYSDRWYLHYAPLKPGEAFQPCTTTTDDVFDICWNRYFINDPSPMPQASSSTSSNSRGTLS